MNFRRYVHFGDIYFVNIFLNTYDYSGSCGRKSGDYWALKTLNTRRQKLLKNAANGCCVQEWLYSYSLQYGAAFSVIATACKALKCWYIPDLWWWWVVAFFWKLLLDLYFRYEKKPIISSPLNLIAYGIYDHNHLLKKRSITAAIFVSRNSALPSANSRQFLWQLLSICWFYSLFKNRYACSKTTCPRFESLMVYQWISPHKCLKV